MHASDAFKLINYCYYVEVILKHSVEKLLMETGLKQKTWISQFQALRKFHLWF